MSGRCLINGRHFLISSLVGQVHFVLSFRGINVPLWLSEMIRSGPGMKIIDLPGLRDTTSDSETARGGRGQNGSRWICWSGLAVRRA